MPAENRACSESISGISPCASHIGVGEPRHPKLAKAGESSVICGLVPETDGSIFQKEGGDIGTSSNAAKKINCQPIGRLMKIMSSVKINMSKPLPINEGGLRIWYVLCYARLWRDWLS